MLRPSTVRPRRCVVEQDGHPDTAPFGLSDRDVELGGPAIRGIARIARLSRPTRGDPRPIERVLVDPDSQVRVDRELRRASGVDRAPDRLLERWDAERRARDEKRNQNREQTRS
jgi:hypothetical protein